MTICDYFDHNPMHVAKGSDKHIHKCTNKMNITKRCGYNSENDSRLCPISEFKCGKTILPK